MPYQNEIIFFAGYGVICIFVLCIFLALLFLICIAADCLNETLMKTGRLAKNTYSLSVLNRVNRRKQYRKTGEQPARFL